MNGKGWTLGIVLLASLALAVVALALVATPADATITGKQPPASGDWVIDQDTTVLGESIKLVGSIDVVSGYSLKLRNSEVLINSSYQGENGVYIDSGASMEIDDCTIRSDYEPYGWWFDVWGGLKITKARLFNVEDGIWIYSDNVDIMNMTLYAQGSYGLRIANVDPSIHSSEIYLMGYSGWVATGIGVYGNSGDLASPDLGDLYVKVYRNDIIESTSTYTYVYFDMVGFVSSYGRFDTLKDIEITFEGTADVTVNYTGSPYVRVYYYVYGMRFEGGSVLGDLDVTISNSTYYVDADLQVGVNGRLYMYNYFTGFQNYISSDGESPTTFTGLTIMNQMIDYNTNNKYTPYKYYNGYGIYWYPSSSATDSETYTFQGLHIEGIEADRMLYIDTNKNHKFLDNVFMDSYLGSYFVYYNYMYNDVEWIGNTIWNNTMTGGYYFYLYRVYGDFVFEDNDMSENTYYRIYYIYYPQSDHIITGNTFIANKPHTSTYAFFYVRYTYAPLEITDNLFQDNGFQYFMYGYYFYSSFEFSQNQMVNNSGTQWAMYLYYAQSSMDFTENELVNNTFNGFFYSYYQQSDWYIEDNYLLGNEFGSRGFYWLYGYWYGGGLYITDNLFENNSGSGKYFELFGIGYWGTRTFTFERNVFINNTASTASTGGLVYFYKVRQTLAIRDNEFHFNSANCIVFNTPYYYGYYYQGEENHWFYVEGNSFYNNTGKSIYFEQIDNNHIQISGNKGSGNEDYCVYVYSKDDKQYIYGDSDHYGIYCYYNAQGPDTLIVENNNFSYNPGGGMWLSTSQTDSSPSGNYYPYGNPDQLVRVKNNILAGNGPNGWSLGFDKLYRKPTVKANRLDGSSMGEFWGLIADSRAVTFDMEYEEIVLDGGEDGMTAFGFRNVDAMFTDCKFTNYKKAFYAMDCEVNIYWSAVPEASGETEGKGRIYVWNHLEVWVTWANATGADSGIPVPGAVVAMQGANGKYFGALVTNSEGKLFDQYGEPMVITPWTCVDGVMDSWSPLKVTIMANEVSTLHDVSVEDDYIAPNPKRLTVNDIYIPEVIISNPQDGTLVNTPDVLTEGFLFEIGSGIVAFEGRTDQMPEDEWQDMSEAVLWQHVFAGMTEGYHNLSVRAADLSGNWNTSNIEIIVDLTDPGLELYLEYLNATKIPYDPVKGGYFVRDKEIAINGTYDDNFATLGEIAIRINGVPKYIFPSQWGKIYERIQLAQGINTIIVDATDTAGNRHVERRYVSLDSYPPTMYIYNPLDGHMTGNRTLTVVGLTEPNTRLDLVVQASAGTNTYQTYSGADGTFTYPVDLFENIQKLVVTAMDSAGNPTVIDLNVILDTTPPEFVINQPPEVHTTTKETRYEIVATMTSEPDADFWIGGQLVEHSGVPRREVVLQEGENTIILIAIDRVGNENVKTVVIVRDTIPPALGVMSPEEDYMIINDPLIPFRGMVEGATGVVIEHKSVRLPATLVEGTWTEGEWMYDLELGPSDLEQDIKVIALDAAGNEDVMIVHVVLDIVPPSLSIENVAEEVKTPFVWINGTTDSGIAYVYVQGVPYAVTNGVFEIQWSLAAGTNDLTVEVYDEAGNVAKDTVSTEYKLTEYKPPEPPKTDEIDWLFVAGVGLLLAAIIIAVTALFVVSSRRRR